MNLFPTSFRTLTVSLTVAVALTCGAASALLGVCGPFTDVTDAAFCPFVLEIFTLGITTGTSPTTYDPTSTVSRLQMAAFLSRTVDGVLKRGSRRAALGQFWSPRDETALTGTTVGLGPVFVQSDGVDLWVTNAGNSISRVRASDGRLVETWTAANPYGVLVAMGRVFVASNVFPDSKLYSIDPSQPAGAATTVAFPGLGPQGITFDGARIWTANALSSVSIITPGSTIPWTVTTVTTGFQRPEGALFDGANIWVVDQDAGTLLKLDSFGSIVQTVTVGSQPSFPVFDGSNIWVPNTVSNSVSVVRVTTGAVLRTLTGNGLAGPVVGAFDGERVLITSLDTISLWKAADLTPLSFISTGLNTLPFGACSDGVNFWVVLNSKSKLARF